MADPGAKRISSTRPALNPHVVIAGDVGVEAEVAGPAPAQPPPAPPVAPAPPPGRGPVGQNRHVVIQGDLAGSVVPPPTAGPAARSALRPAPQPRPAPVVPPTPTPPARPQTRPAPGPVRPTPRRRPRAPGIRWAKRIAIGLATLVVLGIAGGLLVGWWAFNQIERVPVAAALSPRTGSATNLLIVGTDSREGIDPDQDDADAFLGGGFSDSGPSRTDTMMVLRVNGDEQTLLSIPRDLWVTNPVTGQQGRINAVYQSGPAALIDAVESLGIPVHHYAEVNFVSFAELVDAVGGIDVVFEHPARDINSGLLVDEAGVARLDGPQALAFVRSRFYEELVDGQWVSDPTADLGRVERQRAFVGALVRELSGTRNPFTLLGVLDAMGSNAGLKIDDALGYFEALRLGWSLRGFEPTSETLPVVGVNRGGASTLDLGPGAELLIAEFQG